MRLNCCQPADFELLKTVHTEEIPIVIKVARKSVSLLNFAANLCNCNPALQRRLHV